MTIIASPLHIDVVKTYYTSIGNIHVFDNYVVAEYNEGLHLSFNDYNEIIGIIDKHFGSKNFGFVANRINSYSLMLTDAPKFQSAMPNLIAYGIVYYSEFARKNAELEKRFYQFNRESFDTLEGGINWVKTELSNFNG